MFKIPRVNVIESDLGFSIEVLGRTGLRYTEQNKSMKVDSEMLAGPSGLILYTDSIIRWDPPDEKEKVDEKAKQRIIANICEAFRFRGLEIQVQ
jgi:hypothetical protein